MKIISFFIISLLILVAGCDNSPVKNEEKVARIVKLSDFTMPQYDQALNGNVKKIHSNYKKVWQTQLKDEIKSTPALVGDKLFVGDLSGIFYCLDRSSGKQLWAVNLGAGIEASPLILYSKIYVGTLEGEFFCLDLNSGKELWKHSTGEQIYGTANFFKSESQTFVVFGSYDFKIYALDSATGELMWSVKSGNYVHGAVAISEQLKKAAFGGCDGKLRIVDLVSGKENKVIDLDSYIPASPTIWENQAIAGSHQGKLTIVDINSGKTLWTYDGGKGSKPFMATPAVNSEHLVTVQRDGKVLIFDRINGAVKSTFSCRGDSDVPVILGEEKAVAVDEEGWLYIIKVATGKLVTEIELGVSVLARPALVDDKLYFGDEQGFLQMWQAEK